MRRIEIARLLLLLCCIGVWVKADLCSVRLEQKEQILTVYFDIAQGSKLIVDSIAVEGDGLSAFSENDIPSIPSDDYGQVCITPFSLKFHVASEAKKVKIGFQGCDEKTCYLPQEQEYELESGKSIAVENVTEKTKYLTASGYMTPEEFCLWASGKTSEKNLLQKTFERFGFLAVLLLLLPLGFLLNLTPCILPMMPINLALIGAGENVARKERLLRGILYGAGMSFAYGSLGLVTILTGSQFGALSASPVFNVLMCLVFLALGLSMFGMYDIDFTRYRKNGAIYGGMGVFIAGMLSAILSGACVAPVLIWALLLATSLYSEGNVLALLIPYILGIGMALPWPLVAAGLTKLPRPGRWMLHLRRGFAVLILIFAVYCGYRSVQSMRSSTADYTDYTVALGQAKKEGKALLVVFRGRVCHACDKMERTTFRNEEVRQLMSKWVCVTVDVDDAKNAALLQEYAVKGVPTYVLRSAVSFVGGDSGTTNEHN